MCDTEMRENLHLDPRVQREALRILSSDGPMAHDRLAHELGCNWDELQKVIRVLRNEGKVSLTIDRRYALNNQKS